MIFLPDPGFGNLTHNEGRYEDSVLDEVVSLCSDSDLIGISLMTNFFVNAAQITRKIKCNLDTPVIWGGVHPTIRPEESLELADIVCIGEGEEALLELAGSMDRGEDYSNIAGLWFKIDGKIKNNPLRLLVRNLDVYPVPDYLMNDHHILLDGHMFPLTHKLTESFIKKNGLSNNVNKIVYQTMTGRGCPHKCSYCNNDTMRNMYKGQGYLRWHSSERIIKELVWVKKHMDYIDFIWISDDVFLARKLKDIEEFCHEYKKKIALPFLCLTSPTLVTDEKMASLVDAGLISIQMGIESTSSKMQDLFNRKSMSNERIMKAVKIINKYKKKMFPPTYDFIIDVPYETDEDRIESLMFVSRMPKPFRIQLFSLVFYPGTKLYQIAKDDGFIKDEKKLIYEKGFSIRERGYLTMLMVLSDKLPGVLLRFCISSPIVYILNSKVMRPLFRHLYAFLKAVHERLNTQKT